MDCLLYTSAVTDAITAIGAGVGLAVLLNFLRNADTAAGFLGGIGRVVTWLDDPNASIPYKER